MINLSGAAITSAEIKISNYVNGEDILAFNPNDNTGNIVGTFNSATGILTLTPSGNSASVAQFQAALQAISYANRSDDPTTTPRDIVFTVTNTSNIHNISNELHDTVRIIQINDAPTLVTTPVGGEALQTNNGSGVFITLLSLIHISEPTRPY